LAVVSSLVEHGADLNIQNFNGESPLHLACSFGHKEVAKFLLEHGAQTNRKTLEGASGSKLALLISVNIS
jgi:ankyrin repeat protein